MTKKWYPKPIRERLARWAAYKQDLKQHRPLMYWVVEITETLGSAIILALIIKQFFLQSSLVFSGSMIPTLQIGDRVIVNKIPFYYRTPQHGEVILFESPYRDGREFVKRLVGLPGDRILIQRGDVYINDRPVTFAGVNVDEDYSFFGPITVPSGHYFVLGDNRGNSADSRVWGFVPQKDLIGIAEFIYWPPSRIQVVH